MTSVIVNGARTPMGRLLGGLKDLPATQLGTIAIKAALERAGVAPEQAAQCIFGYTCVNDVTAIEIIARDASFAQWTRAKSFDVIATLNLNGDYISDALAAQVGGIGIAPGANMSDSVACFEATHGTAPKYAGKDYVNPGSEILSAEMMLRHMGWKEAADLIISSMEHSILSKRVTYDFARLMDGATQVSCSGFGQVMIDNM